MAVEIEITIMANNSAIVSSVKIVRTWATMTSFVRIPRGEVRRDNGKERKSQVREVAPFTDTLTPNCTSSKTRRASRRILRRPSSSARARPEKQKEETRDTISKRKSMKEYHEDILSQRQEEKLGIIGRGMGISFVI